ncbi:tRNA (adenosine(37)-N6)-threonylcarbamoyltransferase complex ATPase subunit type 1 TsaE [Sulfitobacter sp. D35]|uniref:tRNA (adenosine(37)-N6)-threonylcarbamoyltransferase complex ATPase subunit type 1 TsaE n=1 Tax=Sulfitobacter sp. D35 TaxID=3083252 RepID=UPI00296E3A9F|nr:tRNA (adenosine(37)-N6)-threonylcarbamoyltransferase complex ATPase subunit type 1 TsaE [Sulfitobacter sp. D35]MDW4498093.1 tRNA (adenosine(37)-N6)-threonylcarbamoyltransferase complex ATPase subunit type 1 TsaE [Sulfitobacter sp. D35]
MSPRRVTKTLSSEAETARYAAALGAQLREGNTILLSGPVGAGKTHFARSLIQAILTEPEDVPSPTFTLVQTYDTRQGPLWHADLYRVGSTLEIEELGLAEAFATAICLVEWPDRLGALRPPNALDITLTDGGDEYARVLTASWTDTGWDARVEGDPT